MTCGANRSRLGQTRGGLRTIICADAQWRSKELTAQIYPMRSIGVVLSRRDHREKQAYSGSCMPVFGWDSWTRTSEMQESKSCALTNLAISQYLLARLLYHGFELLSRNFVRNFRATVAFLFQFLIQRLTKKAFYVKL